MILGFGVDLLGFASAGALLSYGEGQIVLVHRIKQEDKQDSV